MVLHYRWQWDLSDGEFNSNYMRTLTLLFLPALFLLMSFANPDAVSPLDKDDFSTNFKSTFEAAKKRFVSEIGSLQNGSTGSYAKMFSTTILFKNATSVIVEDNDQLKICQIIYSFDASTLDEAKGIKKLTSDLVKTLVPADYKMYSTYTAGYAGYMTDVFEYNSDIFAEISKRPVVRVGIILKSEGKYQLEILIAEPVFKTTDRPVKEKK
jgi:hypothetical protein